MTYPSHRSEEPATPDTHGAFSALALVEKKSAGKPAQTPVRAGVTKVGTVCRTVPSYFRPTSLAMLCLGNGANSKGPPRQGGPTIVTLAPPVLRCCLEITSLSSNRQTFWPIPERSASRRLPCGLLLSVRTRPRQALRSHEFPSFGPQRPRVYGF